MNERKKQFSGIFSLSIWRHVACTIQGGPTMKQTKNTQIKCPSKCLLTLRSWNQLQHKTAYTHTGHTPTYQTTTLAQIAFEFELFFLFTKSTANNSYFTQTLDCHSFDSVARLHDCRQNGNKSRSQWKLRMCSRRKWSNFLRVFCVASIRQKRFVHLQNYDVQRKLA